MLVVNILYCGALMLCRTWHITHGQQQMPSHNPTGQTLQTSHQPCFVDDIFAALRESVEDDSQLTNHSLALFGMSTVSNSLSALLEITKKTSRGERNGLEFLHPTGVLVAEEDDRETLNLTFDLPPSPLLKMSPMLLLAFEHPFRGEDMDVTFTSQSLQPNTQSAYISGETKYMLLTGKASDTAFHQKWMISVETNSPMKQTLKDALIGGKSGSSISITPLLLFSGGTGTDSSAHATSMTFSFLCELKRFLGDVLPHDNPESPPLQLDSLPSMPPLSLDIFSSDTLLAALINSSSPTIFRFPRWGSVSQWHPGQLAMSPTLVEEVGQRLEQIELELMDVFRLREDGHRTKKRLERLQALGAFPITQPAAAETQYRAFLLLKALQTVARVYSAQRGPRATRADPSNPVRSSICGLRSLTVSLERRLMGPNTANINNCQGSCAFPLTNANNHSVLLHFYIESGNVNERAPCCVPVAYEPLEVVDLNEHGTYLTIKPDVVATECGCR
uniref:Anti-Mullerian hormone n=1 Tax=Echeneis naucrates TaxID=173247 RepID=A0A665WI74_ECHNA